jgi:pseudomonalisin
MLRKAMLALVLVAVACLRAHAAGAAADVTLDDGARVALPGSVRPEAAEAVDQGVLARSVPLEHILVQMAPPAEREDAAERFVAALNDPASPDYHRWIGAQEYGRRFGPADADIGKVTAWLRGQGLAVNVVYPGGLIDISRTAGTVADAFRTKIHAVSVDGVRHIANLAEPKVPQALASAVAGIVSLHDFMPRPMF